MHYLRKIQITGRKTTHAQSEEDDLFYWAEKKWYERLKEVQSLKRMIWSSQEKKYPERIAITGGKFLKSETDEDDF